jgi:hypothetical protein
LQQAVQTMQMQQIHQQMEQLLMQMQPHLHQPPLPTMPVDTTGALLQPMLWPPMPTMPSMGETMPPPPLLPACGPIPTGDTSPAPLCGDYSQDISIVTSGFDPSFGCASATPTASGDPECAEQQPECPSPSSPPSSDSKREADGDQRSGNGGKSSAPRSSRRPRGGRRR